MRTVLAVIGSVSLCLLLVYVIFKILEIYNDYERIKYIVIDKDIRGEVFVQTELNKSNTRQIDEMRSTQVDILNRLKTNEIRIEDLESFITSNFLHLTAESTNAEEHN